jgi:hypothetical protein
MQNVLPTIQKFGCTFLRFYCAKHGIPIRRIEGTRDEVAALCEEVFDWERGYEGLFHISSTTIKGTKLLVSDFIKANFIDFKNLDVYGGHYYFRIKKKGDFVINEAYSLKYQIVGSAQFCFLYALYLFLCNREQATVELRKKDFEFNTGFIVTWLQSLMDELTSSEMKQIQENMIQSGYLTKGDAKWKHKVEKAISIVVNNPTDFIKDIEYS